MSGRWARVRELSPQGWGLPWLLDRKWGTLSAFHDEAWWKSPAGVWVPTLRGGAGFSGHQQLGQLVTIPAMGGGGSVDQVTLALDSAYAAGTGGDAIAVRFTLAATHTLSTMYFFIPSFTGTAANVNDLNWEIRVDSGTAGLPTTGSLVASGTYDPASTIGWRAITGIATALTGGTTYWFIIGDADGNGTDFATVAAVARGSYNNLVAQRLWGDNKTTDGWATLTTSGYSALFVGVFADGEIIGQSITASANSTNNALQRGLILTAGFTEQLKLYGLATASAAAYTGVNLWEGTTGPGGTAAANGTALQRVTAAQTAVAVLFATPPTLAKATQYRLVFTYGGNSTSPIKYNIGTGTDANLRAARLGGGAWHWTEEQAGPVWVEDTNAWPNTALLVEDQVAISAGGGIVRANMAGGLL